MVSLKFIGLLVLSSARTWMVVLGRGGEPRKVLAGTYFEGSSNIDQEMKGEINFSDCVAIPVLVTIVITEAPTSRPTVSPNRSAPTPICSRLGNNSSSTGGVIYDPRFFAPGMPHHLNPRPGEAYIPACQDSIVLPTPTDKQWARPGGSGRHKIIRPTPDPQRGTEELSIIPFTTVSSSRPELASPAQDLARSDSYVPEIGSVPPPVIPQGDEEELPLITLENGFVRGVGDI